MPNLNDQQKRLICQGIQNINEYKCGNLRFNQLVSRLEGVIHAGDFKDVSFVEDFYRVWMPLEIINSSGVTSVDPVLIVQNVDAVAEFLTRSQL